MLNIVTFSLLLFGSECREAYLNKVLDVEKYSGYYLVMKANIGGKIADISVENYRLFRCLKSKGIINDKEGFAIFMKGKIERDEAIVLQQGYLETMVAGVIYEDHEIMAYDSSSMDAMFSKYFHVWTKYNYADFNPNLTGKKIGALMKVLFRNNYLIELVEGKFAVEDINFCKLVEQSSNK
jgi:hypothetical protein